ncbi:MAG: hypothetical protein M0D57_20385 [Sphingobacteriales bacterium JAD_PAG50586_3]|nr:MAG: hypothetical protein M0D57_20385 [Sphingobacteriales bacterium JAD_PAG50586_3]
MKKLLLLFLTFSGILAHAQSLPIGHLTVETTDPARNNRSVTAEVYYPGTSAGDDVPVATGSFPLVIFGHGFLMQAAVYNNIWEELVPNGYVCVF